MVRVFGGCAERDGGVDPGNFKLDVHVDDKLGLGRIE